MDFAEIDLAPAAAEGADLHVCHPVTGEPLSEPDGSPIVITLQGNDSPAFRDALADLSDRASGRRKVTTAAMETRSVELLTKVTLAWSGIEWEGKPLECTPANVRMLYRARPWLREQVDAFVVERGNFYRAAKPV